MLHRRHFGCWVLSLAALLSSTAAAATPAALRAVREKLVGTWEATPSLDLQLLRTDPTQSPAFARANALGVRVIYTFAADGSATVTQLNRDGPANGETLDRLLPRRSAVKWDVTDVVGKKVKLTITREGNQAPLKYEVETIDDNTLEMDVFELQAKLFISPATFRRNVGERAVRWIQANTTPGPESSLVQDMRKAISPFVNRGEDFAIRFGKGLCKSGKVTQISGYSEQLFVFEFTDAQATALKFVDPSGVSIQHSGRAETFPVLYDAQMETFKLDAPARVAFSTPLKGSFTAKQLNSLMLADEELNFTLRIGIHAGDNTYFAFQPVLSPFGSKFEMKLSPKLATYTGPAIIYADVCRETRFAEGVSAIEVLSTSKPLLVNVVAKP